MSKLVSTWYCYDCKKDIEYIDDLTSPKCPRCSKAYDGGPISHSRTYAEGEFLAEMKEKLRSASKMEKEEFYQLKYHDGTIGDVQRFNEGFPPPDTMTSNGNRKTFKKSNTVVMIYIYEELLEAKDDK